MIIAYCPTAKGLDRIELGPNDSLPTTSVWIDLFAPTHEEQARAERLMGAEIPTREEMASIEFSERLYLEPGAMVMTGLLPMATTTIDPALSSVTFVLNSKRLVTVRYGQPKSIDICARKVQSDASIPHKGPAILFTLLDVIVDRCADEMEAVSSRYDALSLRVFGDQLSSRRTASYREAIKEMGRIGLNVAKLHDVCASLGRLLLFLSTHDHRVELTKEQSATCKMLGRDIHSVKEHADSLDNKLNFLLDATVGLVTLQQNQIITIFSVLGVIFLPPTLIASIYGMNFVNMPELQWSFGFPFSIALMIASVAITFLFFRWRKLF